MVQSDESMKISSAQTQQSKTNIKHLLENSVYLMYKRIYAFFSVVSFFSFVLLGGRGKEAAFQT